MILGENVIKEAKTIKKHYRREGKCDTFSKTSVLFSDQIYIHIAAPLPGIISVGIIRIIRILITGCTALGDSRRY